MLTNRNTEIWITKRGVAHSSKRQRTSNTVGRNKFIAASTTEGTSEPKAELSLEYAVTRVV